MKRVSLVTWLAERAVFEHRLGQTYFLTLILLTWIIWWSPNNASKWQMEFNSAFKWLTYLCFVSKTLPQPCEFYSVLCKMGFKTSQKKCRKCMQWPRCLEEERKPIKVLYLQTPYRSKIELTSYRAELPTKKPRISETVVIFPGNLETIRYHGTDSMVGKNAFRS